MMNIEQLTLNQDLLTEIVNNYRNGEQLLILLKGGGQWVFFCET